MLSQLSNDLLLLGSSLVGSPLKTTAAPDLRAALGGAEVGTLGGAASTFEGAAAAAELEEGVLDWLSNSADSFLTMFSEDGENFLQHFCQIVTSLLLPVPFLLLISDIYCLDLLIYFNLL